MKLGPASKYRSPSRGHSNLAAITYVSWAAFLAACLTLWTLAPSLTLVQDHFVPKPPFNGVSIHAHAMVSPNRLMQQKPAALLLAKAVASQTGPAQLVQPLPVSSGQNSTSAATQDTKQQPCAQREPQHKDTQRLRPQPQQEQQQPPVSPVLDPLHGLPADLVRHIGPVDVVYLWVNGSDPVLAQELQELHDRQPAHHAGTDSTATQGNSSGHSPPKPVENPARKSRFDAGCDELRYSLRSVERYMPWFRHIYIVTNGQVPLWLATNKHRVTVVPHSSIFERAADLPTFNSAAIQANIANIPGLSETFIMMDDDLFLTEPWTLRDFITLDGGQTLTGSTLTSNIKPKGNLYLQRSLNTAAIFKQNFGPHPRYDPAHAPRLLHKRYMKALQQKLPKEFEGTSAAKLRSPTDIVVPSAYMWYVSQFQPGSHPVVPDARTSFMSTATNRGLAYMRAADADFRARVKANDKTAAAFLNTVQSPRHPITLQQTTDYEGKLSQHGPALLGREQEHLLHLIRAWSQPGARVVCLNDDANDTVSASRPSVIRRFLAMRYSTPSTFELPANATNGCNGRLPRTPYGSLPGPAEFSRICSPHPVSATQPPRHHQQQSTTAAAGHLAATSAASPKCNHSASGISRHVVAPKALLAAHKLSGPISGASQHAAVTPGGLVNSPSPQKLTPHPGLNKQTAVI